MINFLRDVPPQCLSGLKTFVEKCMYHSMDSNHEKKSTILCNLVKHTTALEELEIKCDTRNSEMISTIAQNGSHLLTLNLQCISKDIIISSLHDLEASKTWWTPLIVDQLKTVGSACPQLMEMKVDLALPRDPHTLSASSRSMPKVTTTPTSTVMTRSMGKVQNAKRDATTTDRDDSKDGGVEESKARREIPSWYIDAYLREKFLDTGPVGWRRVLGLHGMVERGFDHDQANDEYEMWRRNRRQEEVAILRNQVHANPASALAGFRNLRRLSIFTRINHFVAPEHDPKTYARTREEVTDWLNELILMKEGAGFEEVVVHVTSDVVNEVFPNYPKRLESTYTYAGERYFNGRVKICEKIGPFPK